MGSAACSIAAVFMAIMYYGLVYSIAEMSPALPHTGGAYSFARSAMGPWGGFLTGLAENMEYVITPAVVVGAMGLLMQQIVVGLFEAGGTSTRRDRREPLVEQPAVLVGWSSTSSSWASTSSGSKPRCGSRSSITVLSIAVLVFFFLAAIFSGKLDF